MASWIDTLKSWLLSTLIGHKITCNRVILHYRRRNSDYAGWGLHVWGHWVENTDWNSPLTPSERDEFGICWSIAIKEGADELNFIIHNENEKDPGPDQILKFSEKGCEIWLVQGQEKQFTNPDDASDAMAIRLRPAPTPKDHQVLLHYRRTAEDYDNWGLHIWDGVAEKASWVEPLKPLGRDDYGIYWLVNLLPGSQVLNFIIHKGDTKDPGPEQSLDTSRFGTEVYLIQGSGDKFTDSDSACKAILIADIGDIKNMAQAHWLTRNLIAWPNVFNEHASFMFHYNLSGGLEITKDGLANGEVFRLNWVEHHLTPALAAKFPHLQRACLLEIPGEYVDLVPDILKGQFAVSVHNPDEVIYHATALQIPGVIDDLYACAAKNSELGIQWDNAVPTLRVWAPTAKSVGLVLYPSSDPEQPGETIPMAYESSSGVWEIIGQPEWKGLYYQYDVDVFIRQQGQFLHNFVTDPYSISLSTNSLRSQIIDLNDSALKPAEWDKMIKPSLAAFTDIVLYELHVRDFSATDYTIPETERGTYLAFARFDSNGMKHLHSLAEAGLTHVHLMPVFDFATVNEDKSKWKQVNFNELAQFPPDSEQQQAAIRSIRDEDGFNWGYDPYHYTTPEGSYATCPDGASRVHEFRQMVAGLSEIGLRVVMDVVYNHTKASGQEENSVLDRIVPGYYYRLDDNGYVANSTCCANTATEHIMMEKLMLDSLKVWATQYKIDGFRFDLMGHHMLENIQHVRTMLDELTISAYGVDGHKIYLYGEGWDFGEVAGGIRGRNASQYNTAGTGIGTFNDRFRDATRGGNPFGDITEQGYLTGLYTDTNESDNQPEATRLDKLFEQEDQIRVALAGNLAAYQLVNCHGHFVRGDCVNYRDQGCGYTKSPQEHVAYISAHDNDTLFDIIQYKAPLRISTAERARIQKLGISLVLLSQGIPFLDAGIELLRSKSMDRDSYNSGDWFNRLDFTYQQNNWGVGLPLQDINGHHWPLIRQRLGNPNLTPKPEDILATRNHALEMLQIRKSSPLFRLQSAEEIARRVRFFNTGPGHIPGLIVMALDDNKPLRDLDPFTDLIIVFFNAEDIWVSFSFHELKNACLSLHPIQAMSQDLIVKQTYFDEKTNTFRIPGRTTAVFVGQGTLPPL